MGLPPEGSWALLYFLTEWGIRLAALAIVPFRRSPASARAWLLLLLFLPVPGLFLYLLIGRPTYSRGRLDRLARARALLKSATSEIAHSRHCRQPKLAKNFQTAAILIEQLGHFPALGDNQLELLADYDGTIDRLVSEIDRATHHVHLLTYIFADDATGSRVIDAVARAAARGVECRILLDAIGSRRWAKEVLRRLTAAGAAAAEALPVAPWRRGSARADLRNHRKIVIIDGGLGFIGSQNLIDADSAPGLVNEELVALVAGPVAVELQTLFAVDWFLETEEILSGPTYFRHLHGPGNAITQLMPSGPDYGDAALDRLVVALIYGARHRVVITTPYFIPEAALVQALRTAVERGVAVHLVVPRRIDQKFVQFAQQSYYAELLEAGVRIHRHRTRFIHAKHISVDDDITLIGSSNVDVRSFVLNAEASLITYDRQVTAALAVEQQRNFDGSDLLILSDWERRPLAVKLGENLARLVSPLL